MHNNYKFISYMDSKQEQRIKYLEEEHQSSPNEPFNPYALALEYAQLDSEKADYYFSLTLENFPEYLACYYAAANFFFETENYDKAEDTFKRGIALAQKLQKEKPEKELKASYAMFLDEIND